MAIVAGLFVLVLGGLLGPRKGALATLTGLSLYTPVESAAPAVVWATIMGGFALFAWNDQ